VVGGSVVVGDAFVVVGGGSVVVGGGTVVVTGGGTTRGVTRTGGFGGAISTVVVGAASVVGTATVVVAATVGAVSRLAVDTAGRGHRNTIASTATAAAAPPAPTSAAGLRRCWAGA
jgi:hypothetical protein